MSGDDADVGSTVERWEKESHMAAALFGKFQQPLAVQLAAGTLDMDLRKLPLVIAF